MATDTMTTTASLFLGLPAEVRESCYRYAFAEHAVHVCDPKLHRSIGGPNRPRNRRLPGILRASKQLRKEASPVFAQEAQFEFNDFFNFSQLVSAVPNDIAQRVRRISLKGDAVPFPTLSKFPALRHVTYQQLGNCFFVPTEDNKYNEHASQASLTELTDLVLGRSPALNLLESSSREGSFSLTVRASIVSCLERVSIHIDLSNQRLLESQILAQHRFFECRTPRSEPESAESKSKKEERRPAIDLAQIFGFGTATGDEGDAD